MEPPKDEYGILRQGCFVDSQILHQSRDSPSNHQDQQGIFDDCSTTSSAADTTCAIDDPRYLSETQAACDAFHAAETMMLLAGTPAEDRQRAEVCPAHRSNAGCLQHTTRKTKTDAASLQSNSAKSQPQSRYDWRYQDPVSDTIESHHVVPHYRTRISVPRIGKDAVLTKRRYYPYSQMLVEDRERCRHACWRFNKQSGEGIVPFKLFNLSSELFRSIVQPPQRARNSFLDGKIGNNVIVAPPFVCEYGYNICIGDNVHIGPNCTINDASPVIIGNGCVLGPGVLILTELPTDSRSRAVNHSLRVVQGVTIEKGCWIGGGVVICAGVCIGKGSTILPGTVITKVGGSNSF
ncbi:maltose O-acetyltransferase [Verticillium dahliae]|nr:maltose O-acetyltransferase [Verticillium dahliae]